MDLTKAIMSSKK